jgi:hypothetical protein
MHNTSVVKTPLPFKHPFLDVWGVISISTANFHQFLHASM